VSKRRQPQGGFTLIELMVSLVVVSIAVGFIFRVYATTSVAYRSQAQVSELQQTLRTAKQKLTHDLRMAGFMARQLQSALDPTQMNWLGGGAMVATNVYSVAPIAVINSATGPDQIRIVGADTSCATHVIRLGPAWNPSQSTVAGESCFVTGDLVVAVRTAQPNQGAGCILKLTYVQPAGGGPAVLQHSSNGFPWNTTANAHCENISANWNDGYTAFYKLNARAYRIQPNDTRGTLQVSMTGNMLGGINDWQDLAVGFTDMQVAVQQWQPNDTSSDPDGDGDTRRDWKSGSNMWAPPLVNATDSVLQMRVTLVAHTSSPVEGVTTTTTPDLMGNPPSANPIGDHAAIDLTTITNPSSPLFGEFAYRSVSTVIDFRNLGVGN
jgi:prepilin-type N-terminal cleavage/methylation domain-containing protein